MGNRLCACVACGVARPAALQTGFAGIAAFITHPALVLPGALPQGQNVIGELVFGYLQHHGHWDTAAAVARDVLGGSAAVRQQDVQDMQVGCGGGRRLGPGWRRGVAVTEWAQGGRRPRMRRVGSTPHCSDIFCRCTSSMRPHCTRSSPSTPGCPACTFRRACHRCGSRLESGWRRGTWMLRWR